MDCKTFPFSLHLYEYIELSLLTVVESFNTSAVIFLIIPLVCLLKFWKYNKIFKYVSPFKCYLFWSSFIYFTLCCSLNKIEWMVIFFLDLNFLSLWNVPLCHANIFYFVLYFVWYLYCYFKEMCLLFSFSIFFKKHTHHFITFKKYLYWKQAVV